MVTLCLVAGPVWAAGTGSGTAHVADVAALQVNVGDYKIKGNGSVGKEANRVRVNLERHRLNHTPWFLSTEMRYAQEIRQPYDLRNWGGHLGLGWQFNEADSLLGKVRVDSYKVFNTGPNVDPAFQAVAGRTQAAAWGLDFKHDTRDDSMYPTSGMRWKLLGELAVEALGGDYDFGRLETDFSAYTTPFQNSTEHPEWLWDVTFVEHVRVGWVESFGDTDDVPFFERYFSGGANGVARVDYGVSFDHEGDDSRGKFHLTFKTPF